ncbi:MAG: cell division protein FtsL [Buchnera aphidicola (Nurudea shiraii)]
MNNNTDTLPKIILKDIIKLHKHVLTLILMITVFSILTVITIQKTRLLISQEEQLNEINEKMNLNWSNSILKKSY